MKKDNLFSAEDYNKELLNSLESDKPEQYQQSKNDKFLTKEEWQDMRRAEILWGQAANIVSNYSLMRSTNEGSITRLEIQNKDSVRKEIFEWLWETRNCYQQILKDLEK